MRHFPLIAVAAAMLFTGCVERTLEVRSEPSGARVFLDSMDVGVTPLDIPFHHYGIREIALEMPGFDRAVRRVPLLPPWYQIFPLDLLTDIVLPLPIRDRRVVAVRLEKTAPPAGAKDGEEAALLERASGLRASPSD